MLYQSFQMDYLIKFQPQTFGTYEFTVSPPSKFRWKRNQRQFREILKRRKHMVVSNQLSNKQKNKTCWTGLHWSPNQFFKTSRDIFLYNISLASATKDELYILLVELLFDIFNISVWFDWGLCRDHCHCPAPFTDSVWQKGYFHPFAPHCGYLKPSLFLLSCWFTLFHLIKHKRNSQFHKLLHQSFIACFLLNLFNLGLLILKYSTWQLFIEFYEMGL